MITCTLIEGLRHHIDRSDRDLVSLLARRVKLVNQVEAFKKTTAEVKGPSRVEDVIAKVRAGAEECGASAEVVEKVYRAMIAAFIEEEVSTHAAWKMWYRDLTTPAAIPAPIKSPATSAAARSR
jgi:isochorismate pyruvate lyase